MVGVYGENLSGIKRVILVIDINDPLLKKILNSTARYLSNAGERTDEYHNVNKASKYPNALFADE